MKPDGGNFWPMSLRDFIAIAFLLRNSWGQDAEYRARIAYETADAMLKQRDK